MTLLRLTCVWSKLTEYALRSDALSTESTSEGVRWTALAAAARDAYPALTHSASSAADAKRASSKSGVACTMRSTSGLPSRPASGNNLRSSARLCSMTSIGSYNTNGALMTNSATSHDGNALRSARKRRVVAATSRVSAASVFTPVVFNRPAVASDGSNTNTCSIRFFARATPPRSPCPSSSSSPASSSSAATNVAITSSSRVSVALSPSRCTAAIGTDATAPVAMRVLYRNVASCASCASSSRASDSLRLQ
mmetsp:Transcript_6078/g.20628  ORF Transcript_6078/g.20628 Transcript_6078/m.20628 type:complete len:252 (+) Transcript_6078:270-1025(+)